jgi:serine protease Do
MKRWPIAVASLVVGCMLGMLVAQSWLHGQATRPIVVPKELTSYRDVVKTVLPAVVSLEPKAKPTTRAAQGKKRQPKADDPRVPEDLRRFFEGQDFDLPDEPQGGFGSGFLVDPSGVVLTNYHVVEGASQMEVELRDGRKFLSKEIHSDPKTDLAIVRIEAKQPLPFLQLGDSDAMEIGDRVLAVGAPFGLTGSVTAGIISAKGRNLRMNMYEDFLQTDAAINPGNSGGPLVNLEGKVVGINAAIKSRNGGFQGVGMAVASNLADHVMRQLLKDGRVHRGYLGVQMQELEPDVAVKLGVAAAGGVLVSRVNDDTPASKAGIQDGDVITSVGGKPVKEMRELQRAIAAVTPGSSVDMAIIRDGKPKTLSVTVQEQPKDLGVARSPRFRAPRPDAPTIPIDKIGVEVMELSAEQAEQLGYKGTRGVLVTQVDPDGAAAASGLRRGMVIAKVEKQSVESAKDTRDAVNKVLSKDKSVLLQVWTPGGGTQFVAVKAE